MKEISLGDESKLASSMSEVNLMRSITHKYVVRYIDSFSEHGFLYLVLEYCEKGDLNNYLIRQGDVMELAESRIWKFLI
jgi:serine/threonine protein kinase